MPTVQYLQVPIGELRPNPFNPNRVSAENEKKIRHSIERNGLFKPIIVREVSGISGYEIIGGQHRWEQAKELGHTHIPIANLGEISEKQAREISVIDNARYGVDDTIILGDVLREIGTAAEIQDFMPYSDADITAIFSAATIDLDALDLGKEELSVEPEKHDADAPASKPVKTHTVMRFKIGLADAERITKLIASTQKAQGLTTEDELTNAGDALVHVLSSAGLLAAKTTTTQHEDWDAALDAIEAAQEELK